MSKEIRAADPEILSPDLRIREYLEQAVLPAAAVVVRSPLRVADPEILSPDPRIREYLEQAALPAAEWQEIFFSSPKSA